MLAGYGRFLNDNVRTAHLKCAGCKTQVHLTSIEMDDTGREVRSFICRHCENVSHVRFDRDDRVVEDAPQRDLSTC